jgi:hypothetical protein
VERTDAVAAGGFVGAALATACGTSGIDARHRLQRLTRRAARDAQHASVNSVVIDGARWTGTCSDLVNVTRRCRVNRMWRCAAKQGGTRELSVFRGPLRYSRRGVCEDMLRIGQRMGKCES